MDDHDIESFTRLIQMSISPALLISGVGLLLVSLTNRLGRIIDRSRAMAKELGAESGDQLTTGREQLRILMIRSGYMRLAIGLVTASVFFACLMIFFMFLWTFVGWRVQWAVVGALAFNILSLMAAVVFSLIDVVLSLKALRLEVAPHL